MIQFSANTSPVAFMMMTISFVARRDCFLGDRGSYYWCYIYISKIYAVNMHLSCFSNGIDYSARFRPRVLKRGLKRSLWTILGSVL